ncbi:unnamed protein product [Didymodactylos carnosus]|uniref:Uncharacterized protein n=1 Tax=Didymodactylos carnosus TaxID=1234261 RepID=A0A8S2CQJ5_9BILA|nr:unnamed protein product [Didymodactylos carnosus]CAF3559503.1 unnamed protein product [Didymodactylos carnosus]
MGCDNVRKEFNLKIEMSPPSTQFSQQTTKNYHRSSAATIYDHLINLKKSNYRPNNNKLLIDDSSNLRNYSTIKFNSIPLLPVLDESSTPSRILSFSIDNNTNNNNTVSISIDKKNGDQQSFENDNVTILRERIETGNKNRRCTLTNICFNNDDGTILTQNNGNEQENKLSTNRNSISTWTTINQHISPTATNHAYMKRNSAINKLNDLKQTHYSEHEISQIPVKNIDHNDTKWKSINTSNNAKTNQHYFLLKMNNINCHNTPIDTRIPIDYKTLILNGSKPRRRFHTLPSGNMVIIKKKINNQSKINDNHQPAIVSFDMANDNAKQSFQQNDNIIENQHLTNPFNIDSNNFVNSKRLSNDKSTTIAKQSNNIRSPKKIFQTDERNLPLSSLSCYRSDLSIKPFLLENDHSTLLLREISLKTDGKNNDNDDSNVQQFCRHKSNNRIQQQQKEEVEEEEEKNRVSFCSSSSTISAIPINIKIEKKKNHFLQQNDDDTDKSSKRKIILKQQQENNEDDTLVYYQSSNNLKQILTTKNDLNQKGYRYKPIVILHQTTHRLKTTDKQQISEDETQPQTSYSSSFTTVTSKREINNNNVIEHSSLVTDKTMDSNVMRLISRFDPKANVVNKPRSLNQLKTWHTLPDRSPIISTHPSVSNMSTIIHEKPKLERQKAIDDNDNNSYHHPTMKYSERTRTELIVQPQTTMTTPLKIVIDNDIKNHIEPQQPYQPLITTIKNNTDNRPSRRACAALSKSEWDLRLQNDLTINTIIPVENTSDVIHNHRPLLSRSKSVATINNDDNDDEHDEIKTRSLSTIVRDGSCVEKLRELFANKSSNDLRSSTTTPLNQRISDNEQQQNSSHYLDIDIDQNRRFSDDPSRKQRSVTEVIPTKTKIDSIIFSNNKDLNNRSITTKQNNDTSLDKNSIFNLNNDNNNKRNITKPTVIQQDQDLSPSTSHRTIKKPILKSQKTVEWLKRLVTTYGQQLLNDTV